MILGLSLVQFTVIHVSLSLIGIGAGFFVMFELLTSHRLRILTALFFLSTIGTSLTGFLYPNKTVTPGIVLGALSIIALVLALYAKHGKKLAGPWRATYVVSVCLAFYFNFFVLVAQSFAKVPALKAAAPTMASPAFGLAQLVLLFIFVLLTIRAVKKYRPV
jgi:hypothetical protein